MIFRKPYNFAKIATIFALVFAFIGLNGLHLSSPTAYAAEDSPVGISTTAHLKDPSVAENWNFVTGTNIELTARVLPSEKLKKLEAVTLTLDIDKTYVSTKPVFVDSEQGARSEFIVDPNVWRFRYHYDNFQAVNVYGLPFSFIQDNGSTPNGAQTLVRWSMHTGDGTLIASTEQAVTAVAGLDTDVEYAQWRPENRNYSLTVPAKDKIPVTEIYPYEVADLTQATHTDALKNTQDKLTVYYELNISFSTPHSPDGSTGLELPKTLTFRATLPKTLRLPDEQYERRGWQYEDEAQGIITHTVESGWDDTSSIREVLSLEVVNSPLRDDNGKPFVHTVTFINTVNKGLPNEESSESQDVSIAFVALQAKEKITPPSTEFRTWTYKLLHDKGNFIQFLRYGTDDVRPDYDPKSNSSKILLTTAPKRIRLLNTTRTERKLQPREFELFDIDPRMYVSRIGFDSFYTQYRDTIKALDPRLIGVTGDGQETEIASLAQAIGEDTWPTFGPEIQQYARLLVRFTPSETVPSFDPNPQFHLELTDAEKARFNSDQIAPGEEISYPFKSRVTVHNADAPDTPKVHTYKDSLRVKQRPIPYLQLSLENRNKTEAPYTHCADVINADKELDPFNCPRIVQYDVKINSMNTQSFDGIPENLRVVAFLPNGVEFLRTTPVKVLNGNALVDYPGAVVHVDDNFNNTGNKALVVDLPRTELPQGQYVDISFSFYADVTIYASEDPKDVSVYMSSDLAPNGIAHPYKNIALVSPDERDMDGDADTSEKVVKVSVPIKAKLPAELYALQDVSTNKVNWSFRSPLLHPDQPVYTRVVVRNTSQLRIENAVVFSVLGQEHDHKLTPNQAGKLLPRQWNRQNIDGTQSTVEHSAFRAPLTGPVESLESLVNDRVSKVDDRFIVQYSTTPLTADNSALVETEWLTAEQVKEWAEVRAVKLSTRKGQAIEANETIRFIMPQRMPHVDDVRNLQHSDQSIGSVAVSTNGTSLSEGNETAIRLLRYTVGGKVFKDVNKNAVFDDGDQPMSDVPVTLIDSASGEPVKNLRNEVVTTSNTDGQFIFTDLKGGNYRLQAQKTDTYYFVTNTQKPAGESRSVEPDVVSSITSCRANASGSDFGSSTSCAPDSATTRHFGLTESFSLSETSPVYFGNVGLALITPPEPVKPKDPDPVVPDPVEPYPVTPTPVIPTPVVPQPVVPAPEPVLVPAPAPVRVHVPEQTKAPYKPSPSQVLARTGYAGGSTQLAAFGLAIGSLLVLARYRLR